MSQIKFFTLEIERIDNENYVFECHEIDRSFQLMFLDGEWSLEVRDIDEDSSDVDCDYPIIDEISCIDFQDAFAKISEYCEKELYQE